MAATPAKVLAEQNNLRPVAAGKRRCRNRRAGAGVAAGRGRLGVQRGPSRSRVPEPRRTSPGAGGPGAEARAELRGQGEAPSPTLAPPRDWRCGPALGPGGVPPGSAVGARRSGHRIRRSPGPAAASRGVHRDLLLSGLPSPCSTVPPPPSPTSTRIWAAIQRENQRQEDHIELIASENYASPAVMGAGLAADQQVRRGLPGKRYYGGCEYVDVAEQLAIDRASRSSARIRQRAAELRLAGQPGVFFGLLQPATPSWA